MFTRLIISKFLLPVLFVILVTNPSYSFVEGATKISTRVYKMLKAAKVTKHEVSTLSQLNRAKDITKAIAHHPPETRKVILLAIAEKRGVLKASEADDLYRNIGRVDGFENVTKLLCAANRPNVTGALYELRTANSAHKSGFTVVKIRNEFFGGSNFFKSDVDVLLKTPQGKLVAIECKAYKKSPQWDQIATKVEKMEEFVRQNIGSKIVFSFENEPNLLVKKMLETKEVIVLWGNPDAQMEALKLLV